MSLECGVCERDIRADVDHSECKAAIARQRAKRGVVSDGPMCGSSATNACVYQRGHEGLCSYNANAVENRRLHDENQALREALTWALEEGGWRLWYYAAKPVPAIIETGSIGDPARIKKG